MQYVPELEARGITCEVSPLFDSVYLSRLYGKNSRSVANVARAYASRLLSLTVRRDKYDVLWIEKELLPWIPYWLERLVLSGEIPYIVDYDDAVFHNYDDPQRHLVHTLLGSKIAKVMRGASAVVSGNDYLASYARAAGARKIHTIPTVVDTNRYTVRSDWNGQAPLVIGWMGSPSTAQYLKVMEPALHSLRRMVPYRLMVVGSDAAPVNGVPVSIVRWTEQTEVASLMKFDIGVMPLFDNPWERGKCGYKLIQYMATAMPVVASSVGANKQIVDHGVNGFLCETANDWEEAFRRLVTDAGVRRSFGLKGRATVDERFSLSRAADSLAQIFFEVTEDDVRNRRTH